MAGDGVGELDLQGVEIGVLPDFLLPLLAGGDVGVILLDGGIETAGVVVAKGAMLKLRSP